MILIIILFFLTPLFYYRVIKEHSWEIVKKELFPRTNELRKDLIGSIKLFFCLLTGFFLINFSMIFVEMITNTSIIDMENVSEFVISGFSSNALLFLLIIGITVFAEEFFFRGFLLKKIGVLGSTLVFTFFHLGYESVTQTIGVFFLGLILAYWFKKNNSIIQNYLGHLLYNCLAIVLYLI